MSADEARIAQSILVLCAERAPASVCPSEVARALWPDGEAWRMHMAAVRDVGCRLAQAGRIVITQRGRVLDPSEPSRGAVRYRLNQGG